MYIFEAFLLGLSTGPLCFGYCAPVLIPFLASEEQRVRRTLQLLALFLVGRLAGYLAIGLLSGVLGSVFTASHIRNFSAIASVGLGIILLIFGVAQNFPRFDLCKLLPVEHSSLFYIVALGVLTGVNLCPPFLAAISGAVGTRTIPHAMSYFLFFFLGTSLFLLPIWATGLFSRIYEIRAVARICVILSGIWLLIKGVLMIIAPTT